MKPDVVGLLKKINEEFYQNFGLSFSETRQRIQPGVARVLKEFIVDGHWLDLGCGNGILINNWIDTGLKGSYTGVDFSPVLINEAQENLKKQILPEGLQVQYHKLNFMEKNWVDIAKGRLYDGVLAFASLHHVVSSAERRKLLLAINHLLKPGGLFIHSVWQFQNSPKLMKRVIPWSDQGLADDQVEDGDAILDWRHIPGLDESERGIRYIHLFNKLELIYLAEDSGFSIIEEFESDGKGGNLALYQVWKKPL